MKITINQRGNTEDLIKRYDVEGCSPAYAPGFPLQHSLRR